MVQDPYKVLEISRDASKEEIKRAYRKMGKKYHPDLHPNDPEAAKKMVEINEAYDMLTNPEKYEKRRAEDQRTNTYQNTYTGTNQTGYGPYGQQNQRGTYGGYGWFGDFDFEDLFGFYGSRSSDEKIETMPGDDNDIRQVIDFINMRQFTYARQILNGIVSVRRNARWYYLSAMTNKGLGNTMQALEFINKAIQMEPGNVTYQRAKQNMQRSASNYRQSGQEAQNYAQSMGEFCMKFWLLQMFCMCCR